MYEAFLRSDYYGSSTASLALGRHRTCPSPGWLSRWEGDRGMVPTFTS